MTLILTVALATLLGWLVIGRWVRGWIGGLALGFAAGAGLLSLQMFLYGLARVPWGFGAVFVPWLPLVYARIRSRPSFERPAWPNWLEVAALIALPASSLAWLSYERAMPLNTLNWDAWAVWLFKAKAFYLDGNLAGFLTRAREFSAEPSYPLLVPLLATFLYTLEGAPADHLAKALSPCFFFALLGASYWLVRRFGPRPLALVSTALVANLHMVNIVAFELAGYADTAFSVYLLLGAGCLYAWLKDRQSGDLALASLFSSLAAWTKNEGLLLVAAVAGVLAWRLAAERCRDWRLWALLLVPPAVAVLPWIIVRRLYHVPASGLVEAAGWKWSNLGPALGSIAGQASATGTYNLTFWLLAAALVLARRARPGLYWWVLPGLLFWQLGGLLAAYLRVHGDLVLFIGTSLDRVLAQLAPLALLASALLLAPRLPAPLTPPRASRNLKTKKPS